MASIASVVTRGFGSGIGSVALVVTAGYGNSQAAEVTGQLEVFNIGASYRSFRSATASRAAGSEERALSRRTRYVPSVREK